MSAFRQPNVAAVRENETYSFGPLRFDVAQADKLIELGMIKAPIETVSAASVAKAMSIPVKRGAPLNDATQGVPLFAAIDWQHVAKLTPDDVRLPGILAETKYGHLLIDGNHRMVRAFYDDADAEIQVRVIAKKYVPMITPNTAPYLKAKAAINKRMKAATAAFDMQGDVGKQFTAGPVRYNQHEGMGQVPDNEEVAYKGFAVMMRPSQFYKLTQPADYTDSASMKTVTAIKKALVAGRATGSPWLDVKLTDDKNSITQVIRHEGRHRMKAIEELHGNIPVLVHIFPTGGDRARHISSTQIAAFQKQAYQELSPQQKADLYKKPKSVKRTPVGPNFYPRVWHLDGWKTIGGEEPKQAALSRILVSLSSTSDINSRYKKDLLGRLKDAIGDTDFFGNGIDRIRAFEDFLRSLDIKHPITKEAAK